VPYTLLLADDSVTIQRVIELTFADEDVTVVAVSDGDQAIERLDASPPDIVLADIGMPGKNGYEVAQYIRQTPRLAHIPVVLLTGAFEPVDQARAAEAGCDGVLAKPFEPQLVIGRVKELLARAHRPPDTLDPSLSAPPADPSGHWPPASADQARTPAETQSGPAGLDDYFDRLDAAFSTMPPNAPTPAAPPAPAAVPGADTAAIDWFSTVSPDGAPAAEPWDLPAPPTSVDAPDLSLSYGAPEPASSFEPETAVAPAPASLAPATPRAASAPVPPPPPAPPRQPAELPALADAFAALLAAENGAPSSSAPGWPAAPPPAAVSEQLIEEVTQRVVARLSDQTIRDTVAEIVSKVAEQLIRDEIEKIKAAIK
jgi:CheY-like chemotaxis protein